ncbi:MAG: hypothetical protein Q7K45_05090 [Nanoarchaeota archaeon]|nr:hypothetical protein [Nanoarchaeota archaeon]
MVKNTFITILALLLLLPFAFAAAPVWAPIMDQSIVAGSQLTFTVSATDADGDVMTLRIVSPDFSEVIFTSNASGAGTFTWPTNISRVGVHDFIFSASTTGANSSTETTLETARITVTAATPALSPEEQEYNRLVAQFNDLEDDYSLSKRRYERAVDDDDERDIDDYADDLENIDEDLADVEDDAEDLLNDVEDSNLSNRRELADNIEDLQEDIERVRDRIETLLNDEQETVGTTTVDSYTPVPRVEPQPERTRVVIGTLDFPGGNVANTVEEPAQNWPETRKMVLIGAGVIVLIAVIIFLIALMI